MSYKYFMETWLELLEDSGQWNISRIKCRNYEIFLSIPTMPVSAFFWADKYKFFSTQVCIQFYLLCFITPCTAFLANFQSLLTFLLFLCHLFKLILQSIFKTFHFFYSSFSSELIFFEHCYVLRKWLPNQKWFSR